VTGGCSGSCPAPLLQLELASHQADMANHPKVGAFMKFCETLTPLLGVSYCYAYHSPIDTPQAKGRVDRTPST
jgi:hypothetical protein